MKSLQILDRISISTLFEGGKSAAGLLLILLFAGAEACQSGATELESRPVESLTIAVVNGQPISREQFEAFLAGGEEEPQRERESETRMMRFREFLAEQLLLQEAEKSDVEVGAEELQIKLDQWIPGEADANGAFRDRVRTWISIQKFIKQKLGLQINVTNQQMYNYYQRHSDDFRVSDQAHVLEVLVDDPDVAEDIRRRLPAGDVRAFKDLARIHSTGLTAESGGDLGTFERGELPENFENVIFKLRPGEVSEVFHSSQGYHIFMLEEWVPRHAQKFYEVQSEIFQKLMAEKERAALKDYVRELFEASSIEVMDESLMEWRKVGSGVW